MSNTKTTKPAGSEAGAAGPYGFLFAPLAAFSPAAFGGTDSGGTMPGGTLPGGAGIGTWMRMSELMIGKLTEIQQEEMRFLARRMERDMQHQGNMAGCRSPSEAAEILSAFLRTMVEDYTDNGRRLADATGELQAAFLKLGEAGQDAPAKPPLPQAAE